MAIVKASTRTASRTTTASEFRSTSNTDCSSFPVQSDDKTASMAIADNSAMIENTMPICQ